MPWPQFGRLEKKPGRDLTQETTKNRNKRENLFAILYIFIVESCDPEPNREYAEISGNPLYEEFMRIRNIHIYIYICKKDFDRCATKLLSKDYIRERDIKF